MTRIPSFRLPAYLAALACLFSMSLLSSRVVAEPMSLEDALAVLDGYEAGEYPVAEMARTNFAMTNRLGNLGTETYTTDEYNEYETALRICLDAIDSESLNSRDTDDDFERQARVAESLFRLSLDWRSLGVLDIRDSLSDYLVFNIESLLSEADGFVPGTPDHTAFSQLLFSNLQSLGVVQTSWETADSSDDPYTHQSIEELYAIGVENLENAYQAYEDCRKESINTCIQSTRQVIEDQQSHYDEIDRIVDSVMSDYLNNIDGGHLRGKLSDMSTSLGSNYFILEIRLQCQGIYAPIEEPDRGLTPLAWLMERLGFLSDTLEGGTETIAQRNARRVGGGYQPGGRGPASQDRSIGSRQLDRAAMQEMISCIRSYEGRFKVMQAKIEALGKSWSTALRSNEGMEQFDEDIQSLGTDLEQLTDDMISDFGDMIDP